MKRNAADAEPAANISRAAARGSPGDQEKKPTPAASSKRSRQNVKGWYVMTYSKIIEAIKAENAKHKATAAEYIAENDDTLYRESTETRWNQYKAGKISRDQCAQYATERSARHYEKREAAKIAEAEAIATAPEVQAISIFIDWKRSQNWGHNPHAEIKVYTDRGTYTATGRASGCNYDKQSTAIAEALNQIPAALKLIYDQRENDIKIYGTALYAAAPRYEGGTGTNQIKLILEASNIYMLSHDETKRTDHYYFEKR